MKPVTHIIASINELEELYGTPAAASLTKETNALTPEYKKWIEQSPFFAFASVGADGLDCSPRGDRTDQLLKIIDAKTLHIPDRRGNNRLDTLKNIINNPSVALLFLIPGINETLRVNGSASVSTDPSLLQSFDVNGALPKTVIIIEITSVYFQCARALKRADLWNTSTHIEKNNVPTAGQMIKAASAEFDADAYDTVLDERQSTSLY